MEKMKNTAQKLDTFFKVFSVICTVGIVCALVCLGIIAAGIIFHLVPEQIGTGYHELDFGTLQLTLSENAVPEYSRILGITAVDLFMGLVFIILGKACITCIRGILQPMKEGLPFQDTVTKNLKKLALLYMVMGVASNCMDLVNQLLTVNCYDLTNLLISDKITHVTLMTDFDLTFLVVGAILLLLSYIFSYGQQLQELSDETL